jgi:hypothetical protein
MLAGWSKRNGRLDLGLVVLGDQFPKYVVDIVEGQVGADQTGCAGIPQGWVEPVKKYCPDIQLGTHLPVGIDDPLGAIKDWQVRLLLIKNSTRR